MNGNNPQKSQSLLEFVQASGLKNHISRVGWCEILNAINKLTPKQDDNNENEEIFRPLIDYFDKISIHKWINSDEWIELTNIIAEMHTQISDLKKKGTHE